MATPNTENAKIRANNSLGVYVTNFAKGNCPPGVVDPTIVHCPTEDGCKWSEICKDEDVVCINDVFYYTWRPKGIKDDNVCGAKDPGRHFHLSCNADAVGMRIKGQDLVDIFEFLCDPDVIARFCTWLFDNCLKTDLFMDWVCDTIISFCLEQPAFIDAFCKWFLNSILCIQKFIDGFAEWIIECVFENPDLLDELCDIVEACLKTGILNDRICDIVKKSLTEDQVKKDKICTIVEECLNEKAIRDRICMAIMNDCVKSCVWDSTKDDDPVGTDSGDCWYMVDAATGCISHFAIKCIWTCINGEKPVYAPVVTDGDKVCPVVYPVRFLGRIANDDNELLALARDEYDCPSATFVDEDCTVCFPPECENPPAVIPVTTPPDLCPQIRKDGNSLACPPALPASYKGARINTTAELRTALQLEYGCAITYNSATCKMCAPFDCAGYPTDFIEIVSLASITRAIVCTNGDTYSASAYPITYLGQNYATEAAFRAKLNADSSCSVTITGTNVVYPGVCTSVPAAISIQCSRGVPIVCGDAGTFNGTSSFPVGYLGQQYATPAALATKLGADAGCTVVVSGTTAKYAANCTNVPTSVSVTCQQTRTVVCTNGGTFHGTNSFPIAYAGTVYNSRGAFLAKLSADAGCTVSYSNTVVTYPGGCTNVPAALNVSCNVGCDCVRAPAVNEAIVSVVPMGNNVHRVTTDFGSVWEAQFPAGWTFVNGFTNIGAIVRPNNSIGSVTVRIISVGASNEAECPDIVTASLRSGDIDANGATFSAFVGGNVQPPFGFAQGAGYSFTGNNPWTSATPGSSASQPVEFAGAVDARANSPVPAAGDFLQVNYNFQVADQYSDERVNALVIFTRQVGSCN